MKAVVLYLVLFVLTTGIVAPTRIESMDEDDDSSGMVTEIVDVFTSSKPFTRAESERSDSQPPGESEEKSIAVEEEEEGLMVEGPPRVSESTTETDDNDEGRDPWAVDVGHITRSSVNLDLQFQHYIFLYGIPILIIIGLIGNFTSLAVLIHVMQSARDSESSNTFYLATMCVFDSLVLILYVLPYWADHFLRDELDARNIDHPINMIVNTWGACQIVMFLSFIVRFLCAWTLMIATVERFFLLRSPFEALGYTVSRSKLTVFTLMVVWAAINVHHFWSFDLVTRPEGKFGKLSKVFYFASLGELPLLFIVPTCIIIVFCVLILYKVHTTKKEEAKGADEQTTPKTDYEVTKRLLVVAIVFIILTTPHMVHTFVGVITQVLVGHSEEVLLNIDFFFYTLNFVIKFFLFCATGSAFRSAFVAICCYCTHSKRYRMAVSKRSPRVTGSNLQVGPASQLDKVTNGEAIGNAEDACATVVAGNDTGAKESVVPISSV